ncbi:ABC transporter ATP-binding protein [Helicovermis profundi]|uniref:ABC transporter ATP-binding protein n=1 Tax=Helicovermis profundi TaxID=3065157 RepID=A0AAU9EM48_9FIRM|nr:ABC transporter ATP-binding protein [Clostridia bacterium S502]
MIIEIENLNKNYNEKVIFNKFNLSIKKDIITVILGPSGCGKTTLLNLLSKIDLDYKGSININSDKLSYVFQEDRLLPWLNVKENIMFVNDKLTEKKINDILKDLNLEKEINSYPQKLSGGMKQRVSIARAYSYDSKIMLMDEPFKSLDILLKKDLLGKLAALWDKNRNSIILVTHDPLVASLLADRIVFLSKSPVKILGEIELDLDKKLRFKNSEYVENITEEIHRILGE